MSAFDKRRTNLRNFGMWNQTICHVQHVLSRGQPARR